MDSAEFVDPYLDPEMGLLRNKLGARTKVALDEAEGDLSFARLVQLENHPPAPTGDLDELRAIHRHLFQDVDAGNPTLLHALLGIEAERRRSIGQPASQLGRRSLWKSGLSFLPEAIGWLVAFRTLPSISYEES